MTDNEIIRALECCIKNDLAQCTVCSYHYIPHWCRQTMEEDVLDLINRQKAEIERLEKEIESLNKQYPCTVKISDYCLVYTRSLDDYDKLIDEIESEAIKEFVRRTRGLVTMSDRAKEYYDEIIKEMTEKRGKINV